MKLSTLALAVVLAGLPVAGAYAQGAIIEFPPPALQGPARVLGPLPSHLVVLNDGDLPLKHPTIDPDALVAPPAASATIPLWQNKVKVSAALGGKTDTFIMVGTDPTKATAASNRVTTVPTVIVPVIITIGTHTFDPTTTDPAGCEPKSAEALTLASPIFKNITLKVGGTNVGTGQYPGLFQRANFYRFSNPSGINPNFGLKLTSTQLTISIDLTSIGAIGSVPCGTLGAIELNTWDDLVQKTIFPKLTANLTPKTIPIFLFYNVVLFVNTTNNCCVLGYHNAFTNPDFGNAFQTYSIADFDMTKGFTGVSDISVLTHEIDELQDDPTTGNPTPLWGHIGQVPGCQNNLEVGDPLSGTAVPIKLGGFTYHVQDLAFFSFFYRQNATMASIPAPKTIGNFGSNGWFSLFGSVVPAAQGNPAHNFKTHDAGALCS